MIIANLYYFIVTFMILASASAVMQLWYKTKYTRGICAVTGVAAAILLFVSIVVRTMQTGHLPYNSVYEFTMVFSFMLTVLSLVLMFKMKLHGPVAIILPLALILFASTVGMSSEITNLMPALQSKWRGVHITTAIVAYSCFAVTFGIGIYCLILTARKNNSHSESIVRLESVMQNFVVVGFIFLTLLIVTGAMWAEEAWGSWWSWDPKETWALITWLIYAIYLHLHNRTFWKGRRGYILIVAGFLCVIFTLFGVTFIMGGLHSYR